MTQLEAARAGRITDAMKTVAAKEHLTPEEIRARVASGVVAIPANRAHESLSFEGIGLGLRTKVNVNLGVSGDRANAPLEWEKVRIALDAGAEAIMDLSNCGQTQPFRAELVRRAPVMIGTVPLYDAIGRLGKQLADITPDEFLSVVEAHACDGVDFATIHAGLNRRAVTAYQRSGRRMDIVSRGGSLLFAWMEATGCENPFFERYDDLLAICREHDLTISLGDALRPGCIDDANDAGQIAELVEIGDLVSRAWAAGVQVLVEGPGHMALDEVQASVSVAKRLTHGAPLYVLGPLVCDVAPGYDHITSAIGGAVAAWAGADFLCYVTPAEHLRLPDASDVREGVMAARIAAHAADIAKHVAHARVEDRAMADARRALDWPAMFAHALDPVKPREYYESAPASVEGTCTMCGEMCAVKTMDRALADAAPQRA